MADETVNARINTTANVTGVRELQAELARAVQELEHLQQQAAAGVLIPQSVFAQANANIADLQARISGTASTFAQASGSIANDAGRVGEAVAINFGRVARGGVSLFDEAMRGARGAMVSSVSSMLRDSGLMEAALQKIGPAGMIAAGGVAVVGAAVTYFAYQAYEGYRNTQTIVEQLALFGNVAENSVQHIDNLRSSLRQFGASESEVRKAADALGTIPGISQEDQIALANMAAELARSGREGGDLDKVIQELVKALEGGKEAQDKYATAVGAVIGPSATTHDWIVKITGSLNPLITKLYEAATAWKNYGTAVLAVGEAGMLALPPPPTGATAVTPGAVTQGAVPLPRPDPEVLRAGTKALENEQKRAELQARINSLLGVEEQLRDRLAKNPADQEASDKLKLYQSQAEAMQAELSRMALGPVESVALANAKAQSEVAMRLARQQQDYVKIITEAQKELYNTLKAYGGDAQAPAVQAAQARLEELMNQQAKQQLINDELLNQPAMRRAKEAKDFGAEINLLNQNLAKARETYGGNENAPQIVAIENQITEAKDRQLKQQVQGQIEADQEIASSFKRSAAERVTALQDAANKAKAARYPGGEPMFSPDELARFQEAANRARVSQQSAGAGTAARAERLDFQAFMIAEKDKLTAFRGSASQQEVVINEMRAKAEQAYGATSAAAAKNATIAAAEFRKVSREIDHLAEMAKRADWAEMFRRAKEGASEAHTAIREFEAEMQTRVATPGPEHVTQGQAYGFDLQEIGRQRAAVAEGFAAALDAPGISDSVRKTIEAAAKMADLKFNVDQADLQKKIAEAAEKAAEKFAKPFEAAFDKIGTGIETAITDSLLRKGTTAKIEKQLYQSLVSDAIHQGGSILSGLGGQAIAPLLGVTGKDAEGGVGGVIGKFLAQQLSTLLIHTGLLSSSASSNAATAAATAATAANTAAGAAAGASSALSGAGGAISAVSNAGGFFGAIGKGFSWLASFLPFAGASRGGIVGAAYGGVIPAASGGFTVPAAAGGFQLPRSFGSDSVMTALTPGETVLPVGEKPSELAAAIANRPNVNLHVGQGGMFADGPSFMNWLKNNGGLDLIHHAVSSGMRSNALTPRSITGQGLHR